MGLPFLLVYVRVGERDREVGKPGMPLCHQCHPPASPASLVPPTPCPGIPLFALLFPRLSQYLSPSLPYGALAGTCLCIGDLVALTGGISKCNGRTSAWILMLPPAGHVFHQRAVNTRIWLLALFMESSAAELPSR